MFFFDPFDFDFDKLKVSFDGLSKKCVWDVQLIKSSFNDKYSYYALSLDYTYEGFSQDLLKFVLYKGDEEIILVGNTLYVPKNKLLSKVEIAAISEYSDKLFFGRMVFTPSDYIDLNKMRRSEVSINLNRINELKKKINR